MKPEDPNIETALAKSSPGSIARLLAERPDPANVEAIHRLLDLQLRYDAEAARRAYVDAMSQFKASPPKILKNKQARLERNGTILFSYRHASLDHIVSEVAPALSVHGLSHAWSTSTDAGKARVTCRVTHRLGHAEETTLEAPFDTSGGKNAIQAVGSTVSYLQRYTLLALLGLSPHDVDDDGAAMGDRAPIQQPQRRAEPSQGDHFPPRAPVRIESLEDAEGAIDDAPGGETLWPIECKLTSGEKNGKPWTRHSVTFDGGRRADTFDTKFGAEIQAAIRGGLAVRCTMEPNKNANYPPSITSATAIASREVGADG